MLLKDPRWLTRLGSCSPDWNPGYTLSYTICSEICLTENCCRSHSKSCTNLGFLKKYSSINIRNMFVFLYSWIIYLPYHLVHIGRGPWVQTEKVMDLQNLNKLERVCSIWCHPKTRTRRIGWDVWMLIVVILRRACIFLQVYMKHGWF